MPSAKATYQCLSCRLKDAIPRAAIQNARRQFHASGSQASRRRPAYPNVKAAELEKMEAQQRTNDRLAETLRPYTEREKKLLAMRYTPAQMAAIEAGEKAVSAKDMVSQGRLRGDAFRPTYLDDFATLRPVVDEIKANPSLGQEQSLAEALGRGQEGEDAELQQQPKKRNEKEQIPGTTLSAAGDEEDPHMARLMKQTGMDLAEIRRIRVKNLVVHRVVNQTRMGKIQSMYFLCIAGNGNGMLGIGEGKAVEMPDASRQAMMNAIRNMKPVLRYEDRTIYGEAEAKVGASIVKLSARPPGFGNRCQHLIFELARAAGISDLAARTPRSRNKMNVVKAAFEALTSQRHPEDVARSRGRKLVDVRKVYYGGQVY
ncbi:Hypothetical protein R9X50_00739500 [Acrodontium crateriforme]|uniref:Small ribosomal subunit protein uS5m n=1 Tax=Acrodontium crateriforme TaxID=150365 RepID=A0AAQ3MA43_9PEZI|nr:Hypothetical protein R9X50_00739500 [Acrodontium crateriforme]